MAKTRRAYTGASVESTLNGSIGASGVTTISVDAATNWPYGSDPYYVVISPGTASEEKVLVTRSGSSDLTLAVASDSDRGQDGTSASSHADEATIYPVFTAVDADEANELASMWESKGDIISHGSSTFARLAVGNNDYVLQADSSAASGLAWGQVDTANIANDAVTTAKINADAVTSAKIADDAVDTEHIADASLGRKAMFPVATWTWSSGSTIEETSVSVTESSDPDGITAAVSSTRIKFASTGLYFVEATSMNLPAGYGATGQIKDGGNVIVSVVMSNNPGSGLIYVNGTTNSDYIYVTASGEDQDQNGIKETSATWDAGSLTIYKVIG